MARAPMSRRKQIEALALYPLDWIEERSGLVGAVHLVWNDTRTGKLDLFAATVRP